MNVTPPTPLWALATRGSIRETGAMTIAREWLADGAWALLMLGGVGRGKSLAATWLWLRLNEDDTRESQAPGVFKPRGGVLWLRARALQRLSWQERADVLQRCASAYGLVVDEMGAEDERTSEAIGDVVEERGDRSARTVMTTNLDTNGFLRRYGDRLTSRLRAGGVVDGRARWACVVQGADLRGVTEDEPEGSAEAKAAKPQVTDEQREEILSMYAPEVAALVAGTSEGES